MNWFLAVNTFLTFGAGLWYISNSDLKLGLLQITFTISNIIFLWMGIK